MAMLQLSAVLIWGLLGTSWAQYIYVAAPGTFRLNSDETIAVALEQDKGSPVEVFIQDYPGKIKNITRRRLQVHPDEPKVFKVQLDPAEFPPNFLNTPGSPKLVAVTAASDNFRKEIIVPITTQSGYVFIQTDKPIYTPNQRAQMRIISLNEDAVPSDKIFKLQIMNPERIIVEEKLFNHKAAQSWKAFETHIYKFPTYPVLGEWSAMVRYGYEFQQNTTVYFELQEYVLPTFVVKLKTQDVILPSTDVIKIEVEAKYVYGKMVQGIVTFRLGVKGADSPNTIFFATVGPKELDKGTYNLRIKVEDLQKHKDIGWFPTIEGSRLVVEAAVVDAATGNKEKATDISTQFSKSPFLISFDRCLSDFKPGLNSIFEADITYADGKPAAGIATKIEATADGTLLNIHPNTAISNEQGKVSFEIQPETHHSTLAVKLETNDPKYAGSQAVKTFVQHKFQSATKAYISIARSTPEQLKPGGMFSKVIHFEPENIQHIYYMIISKGKIIAMKRLPPGVFKIQSLKFQISHEMVPNFRLVVFAHYGNEFIADSLKVEVERICDPKAQVSVQTAFNTREPGSAGAVNLQGTSGTWVGLLGVDEAVYALSKKDLLTKAKMFDKFASHDLGCGPGGGVTVNQVLGNAGITIGTNKYDPKQEHTCVEIKRRKRSAAKDIVSTYKTTLEQQCCALGIQHDKHDRSCEDRTNIVVRELKGEYYNCSKAFFACCIYAKENGITEMMVMRQGNFGRIGGDDFGDNLDFIPARDEDAFEKGTLVRSDFRETWIFEDLRIGSEGKKEYQVSLPHSITTWVISAVSVSEKNGMCVTEPQKLVSFKKIFLHLNLPYSVVRNEQVEIQATVFNYGSSRIPATVYMYGVKDLCTGTQAGHKSERKRLAIEPNSAQVVSFPVVPLKAQIFKIKVVALTPEGSDVIEKELLVVPEGTPKEVDIPIKLDPSNQQRRAKRHINTKDYSDTIDPTQNLQVTAVKLAAPEGFIPGTASCSITAMGDQMGPVVETALNNPDGLLQKPRGCGEQNMMFFAPTLYTMRYLKTTGKLTADSETKGYAFIRTGYGNQLSFRKQDGSYAAYQNKPTSTWLTAFVMKVFCQANELVYIDENVLCSGVKWLIDNQEADGSFVEKSPMYHLDMMGGVQGSAPMTAFALIALEECSCDEEKLVIAKKRAVSYLEDHLGDVSKPLPVAIVAYALALSDSELKKTANDKLLSMAQINEDENLMYWETENSAQDIETAGYGLLTQLLFNELTKSASIVNWLNKKQLQSGSFKSTQDTVVALQSLSEYAIRAQMPSINLVANITSSNDRNFHRVLTFHEDNSLILQDVKVDKIGGTLFINTAGHGVGSLAVKLRYNLAVPPEDICKFDVKVKVIEPKQKEDEEKKPKVAGGEEGKEDKVEEDYDWDKEEEEEVKEKKKDEEKEEDEEERKIAEEGIGLLNPRGKDVFDRFPPDLIRGVAKALDEEIPELDIDPRNRGQKRASLVSQLNPENSAKSRVRRQNQDNSKIQYIISICARYLGNKDAEMSIVDVGIFSGFEPDVKKLKELEEDPTHLIQRYEKSSRGVVFYLQMIPIAEDYCFSFPITREYFVNNTQMSVVKVYDYYNPDATCTTFYSPSSNSPILHKICEGGICECAEGGCPSDKALTDTAPLDRVKRRKKIRDIACENYDYVWKGKLNGAPRKEGGFWNITFTIEEVIKEGIEKKNNTQHESRTLLSRDNCAMMFPGQTYLIMGKDGQKYKNSDGIPWYRYLLDQTSVVHLWTSIADAIDPELQRALMTVMRNLDQRGCLK